jgi:hypothetical protein
MGQQGEDADKDALKDLKDLEPRPKRSFRVPVRITGVEKPEPPTLEPCDGMDGCAFRDGRIRELEEDFARAQKLLMHCLDFVVVRADAWARDNGQRKWNDGHLTLILDMYEVIGELPPSLVVEQLALRMTDEELEMVIEKIEAMRDKRDAERGIKH